MSYAPDMKGLELFTMPFRSPQACMMAQASGRGTARSAPASGKPGSRSQPAASRTASPVQQPKASAGQRPDIPQKPVPEKPGAAEPGQEQKPPAENPGSEKKQLSADKPEPPQKELALDMSDHTIPAGKSLGASEDAKRKEHEASEAKRKAEWEARQLAKKQAEEDALQELQSMSDADVVSASTERVRTDVERLTRRNMKECVAGHIQGICQMDPEFARRVMHPRKSLANCFKYINRRAKEYLKNEMEENGIVPENGVYGGDVPDETCYQWAEDYFRDSDAPEDQEKEERFIPRPYPGPTPKPKAKKAARGRKTAKKEPKENNYEQMSLTGVS